ncbi:hypothetical protein JVT61DRAFT_7437 [Boletus reticuloceps]|uniref:Uncharacterized protein n=1 Tax=Boletus reticuloceps TaxID=495285 RepID=A0A8I2YJ56_9AGAM|nr:hypothetical protein JVT61DRAFT_7437 [Boletus reticuloceps]
MLTISEDEEGRCETMPKTGKGKVKASRSSSGDSKAAVVEVESMECRLHSLKDML